MAPAMLCKTCKKTRMGRRVARQMISSQIGNSTPHTSHFLVESQWRTWLKAQIWRTHHIFHGSCCVFDSPRLSLPLHAVCLLSHRLVHPLGLQLLLPRCGGQIPCALSLMRTLTLLPRTSLPHVTSHTATSSQRLMSNTPRSPRMSNGTLMTSTTMTSPSVRRFLTRAKVELMTPMTKVCRPVSRRLSVMEQGDLLLKLSLIH